MEISLQGKVALIAGASVGIGAAIAKTLSSSGASIGIMARRAGRAAKIRSRNYAVWWLCYRRTRWRIET